MAKEKGSRLIANNKKAYHDYFIEETYEAGIALHGTEVKSLRMGKCSIKESFVRIENEEVYIYGMHISTLMDDYYHFDEETYCLVGEKTGHTYRLGQKVTVKVSQVDLSTKSIDFILKEENSCFNKYMDWED